MWGRGGEGEGEGIGGGAAPYALLLFLPFLRMPISLHRTVSGQRTTTLDLACRELASAAAAHASNSAAAAAAICCWRDGCSCHGFYFAKGENGEAEESCSLPSVLLSNVVVASSVDVMTSVS